MCILPSSHLRTSRGFTAIELMVTVAILAILAGIAAPSFNPLIERWRIRQASEELQSTFYFARSEAVKRGGRIIIQRKSDTDNCTEASISTDLWSCGWVVFADLGNDGKLSSGQELQNTPPPAKVSIKFTSAANGDASLSDPIKVDRWGQLSSGGLTNFAFRLTPNDSSNSSSAASVCINSSGHIKRLNTGSGSCT